MKLKGQIAVVTGGGTGIGRAVAFSLADEGCRVVITGRREAILKEAAAAYRGSTPILIHAADVANRQDVERLFAWVRGELGPVDILVNSAGINVARRSMAELDPDDWQRLMAVNATGAYHAIRAVLPDMRRRGSGLVVNVSSIAGKRAGLLGGVAYNASKFAMSALGITVALEEGRHGIRVTNVYPGEVETPILDQRPVPVSAEHRARILQPEDVAAAILMLATLPSRAHIAELVIKPTSQDYV